MRHRRILPWISLLFLIGGRGIGAAEVSEQDYFNDLPVVLTVSRLTQPLNETPGAVTVIDRDKIRRSGARELADVLRLVPGYLVSGYNGAHPGAAYHAPIDELGTRNLVLVDGRPVYSTFYLGDTHRGMMGVLLDDIERIEVLRGANSAAYGANAMFGVINVVTRHAEDTHGGGVSITGGSGGIKDNSARIGWGNDLANFRISAGRRQDNGYGNAYDNKIVSQLHFRGDLRPAADQELMLKLGASEISAGDGFPGEVGNPARTTRYNDLYLQGQWRWQLSATDEIKLVASFDEETFRDAAPYAPDPSVILDAGGRGRRANLEFQHQFGISPQLRAVWGGGYKYEEALAPALYATSDPVSVHEERFFGNLEWRPHARWLINAGGFWGRHSWTGNYFSPRLMANFHVDPDHTLRFGITESSRTPTMFELASDVRFYPKSLTGPFAAFALLGIPVRTFAATGNVRPEALHVQEIGYLGNLRNWRLTIDVRAYIERMRDRIGTDKYTIPGYPLKVDDYVNRAGFDVQGFEYQLRWKPHADTEIWVNQNFLHLRWEDRTIKQPPTHDTTIALFQKLPFNLDLSLMFHSTGAMTWRGNSEWLPNIRRVDARLAYPFRLGATRAEAAVTVQAANGDYAEFLPSANFKFERRAFATLRFEY